MTVLGLYYNALASHCGGFSCAPQTSAVAPHGLSCSMACGIFPDRGANWCLQHWQVGYPLYQPGKPLWYHLLTFQDLWRARASQRTRLILFPPVLVWGLWVRGSARDPTGEVPSPAKLQGLKLRSFQWEETECRLFCTDKVHHLRDWMWGLSVKLDFSCSKAPGLKTGCWLGLVLSGKKRTRAPAGPTCLGQAFSRCS